MVGWEARRGHYSATAVLTIMWSPPSVWSGNYFKINLTQTTACWYKTNLISLFVARNRIKYESILCVVWRRTSLQLLVVRPAAGLGSEEEWRQRHPLHSVVQSPYLIWRRGKKGYRWVYCMMGHATNKVICSRQGKQKTIFAVRSIKFCLWDFYASRPITICVKWTLSSPKQQSYKVNIDQ